MNPTSRLGPRLNAILELVITLQQQNAYPCIWDCCCDHGYLGIKILQKEWCEKLIFVDQVPHIIEQLGKKLAPFSNGKHHLITADAGDLCFDDNQRHLVILAGVGGERTVQILQSIESNHPNASIDYIFCPSSRQHVLREHLHDNDFTIDFESVVHEKRRFYEVMLIKGNGKQSHLPTF